MGSFQPQLPLPKPSWFAGGISAWTHASERPENRDAHEAEDDGHPAADGRDDDVDSSVDGDDLGEVQVWSTPDTDHSATVADLLDDVEEAAEDVETGDEDTAAETHLERAISALQAAKAAL